MNIGPGEIAAIVGIAIVLFFGLRKGYQLHHLSNVKNAYRKMVAHNFFHWEK